MDHDLDPLAGSGLFGMNFDESSLQEDTNNGLFDTQFADSLLNTNPDAAHGPGESDKSGSGNQSGLLDIDWPFGDGAFDTNTLLDLSGAAEDNPSSFMNEPDQSMAQAPSLPLTGMMSQPQASTSIGSKRPMGVPVAISHAMSLSQPATMPFSTASQPPAPGMMGQGAPNMPMGVAPNPTVSQPNAFPGSAANMTTFQAMAAAGQLTPQMQMQMHLMSQAAAQNRMMAAAGQPMHSAAPRPMPSGMTGAFNPALHAMGGNRMSMQAFPPNFNPMTGQMSPGNPTSHMAPTMRPPSRSATPVNMVMGRPSPSTSPALSTTHPSHQSPSALAGLKSPAHGAQLLSDPVGSPLAASPAAFTSPKPSMKTATTPKSMVPAPMTTPTNKSEPQPKRRSVSQSDNLSPGPTKSSVDLLGSEDLPATPRKGNYNPMIPGKTTLKKIEDLRTGLKFPERCINPPKLRELLDMTYTEFTQFLTMFLKEFIKNNPDRKNVKEFKNPQLDNTDVDLKKLFWFVVGSGGFWVVARQKLWKAIGLEMKVSQNNPAAPLLRRWYDDFLLPVEETYVYPRNANTIAEVEAHVQRTRKKGKRKVSQLDAVTSPALSSPRGTPEPLPTDPALTPSRSGGAIKMGPSGLSGVNPMLNAQFKRARPSPASDARSLGAALPLNANLASGPGGSGTTAPGQPTSLWQPAEVHASLTGGHDLRAMMSAAQAKAMVPNLLRPGTVHVSDITRCLQSGLDLEIAQALNLLLAMSFSNPNQLSLSHGPELVQALLELQVNLLVDIQREAQSRSSPPKTPPMSGSENGDEPNAAAPRLNLPGVNRALFANENYSARLARACEYSLALATLWQNLTATGANAEVMARNPVFLRVLQQTLVCHHFEAEDTTRPHHWLYLNEYRKLLLQLVSHLAPHLQLAQWVLAECLVKLFKTVMHPFLGGGTAAAEIPTTAYEHHTWLALDAFCKLTATDTNRACLAELDFSLMKAMLDIVICCCTHWDQRLQPGLQVTSGVATGMVPSGGDLSKATRMAYLLHSVLALYNLVVIADPEKLPPEARMVASSMAATRSDHDMMTDETSGGGGQQGTPPTNGSALGSPTTASKHLPSGYSVRTASDSFRSAILHHPVLVRKLLNTVANIQQTVAVDAQSLVPRETLALVSQIQAQRSTSATGTMALPNLTLPRHPVRAGSMMSSHGVGGGGISGSFLSPTSADYDTLEGTVCIRILEILCAIFPNDEAFCQSFLPDLITLSQFPPPSPAYARLLNMLMTSSSKATPC
ncbi:hypothetical protein H4R34_000840 [Dimargaris verticillata]|uniref:ARID domain-containing protein n=1 Tax=Dimargaris verticillata TaxID=2761393 RepID=A0A9W8BCI6_9FUNG|nr:hypothetical protein H4R34_000840 [Dimargaris verticillata]